MSYPKKIVIYFSKKNIWESKDIFISSYGDAASPAGDATSA
jgi:hypothetical protein